MHWETHRKKPWIIPSSFWTELVLNFPTVLAFDSGSVMLLLISLYPFPSIKICLSVCLHLYLGLYVNVCFTLWYVLPFHLYLFYRIFFFYETFTSLTINVFVQFILNMIMHVIMRVSMIHVNTTVLTAIELFSVTQIVLSARTKKCAKPIHHFFAFSFVRSFIRSFVLSFTFHHFFAF